MSGTLQQQNIDDYMMEFNIDNEEILKNYLVNSNKAMQMQSLDHLKLLATFYNID